jgi:hypothetical protein
VPTGLRRALIVALFVLALPILLFVYQPSLALGGWGMALGAVGWTLSPLILFGVFVLWARQRW